MASTDSNGDFQITLPKEEHIPLNILIAVKKDFLGAQQYLTDTVPPEQRQPGQSSVKDINFEQNENGRTKLPDIKLFPVGIVIFEPNVPITDGYNLTRLRLFWSTSSQDTTPWLKDLLRTPRGSQGGSTFYKSDIVPNVVQTIYVPAGVELTLKIVWISQSERAPISIPSVRLEQGQVLNLGRVEFPLMIRVAVKVIDSRGKPVEGVAVFYHDEDRLDGYTKQSPVTNAEGIAWLNIPPISKGEFLVQSGIPRTRLDTQTTDYLKESTPCQVTGPQDAGKQFTLVLSDEMLKQLFK